MYTRPKKGGGIHKKHLQPNQSIKSNKNNVLDPFYRLVIKAAWASVLPLLPLMLLTIKSLMKFKRPTIQFVQVLPTENSYQVELI